MSKKLAIYCDCDSDSGMLTYTLMLIAALKNHTDVNTLVISSSARNPQEQTRLEKLLLNAQEVIVLPRDYSSAKAAAKAMAEIIIERKVSFFIPNYRYMPHVVLSYLPRKIKNIVIVHNDTGEIYQSIRFYKSAIDGVIYPSHSAYSNSHLNIPAGLKRACIPHYFNSLGEVVDETGEKRRTLEIVYHGRVAHHQKKSMELLKIAQHLNELGTAFSLKIIGSGDAFDDMKKRIEDESIENVKLLGQVSRDQLYAHLKEANIALSTSIFEGFCYSVAEALSLGVVPVAYENNVLGDLIQNDRNGYLVPWGSANLAAERIHYLYLNPQKRLAMRKAGIESVNSLNSSRRYVDEMMSFFNLIESQPLGKSWSPFRPRGLQYDSFISRIIAKFGKKLNLW